MCFTGREFHTRVASSLKTSFLSSDILSLSMLSTITVSSHCLSYETTTLLVWKYSFRGSVTASWQYSLPMPRALLAGVSNGNFVRPAGLPGVRRTTGMVRIGELLP